jgi:uncharacterized protein
MTVDALIKKYSLQKHPEGGFFAETYRSATSVISPVNGCERASMTDIYFLLSKNEISRFHKVDHDEVWHFYEGDPLKIVRFDGKNVSEYIIGLNCEDGYKVVIEDGAYQAAVPMGDYALVGCTVAPGFDFADFSFMADNASVEQDFRVNHPDYVSLI